MRITFLLLAIFFACYSGEHITNKTLTGKVYVTGNEPFVQLAIEETNKKVYIISKDSPVYRELWQNQGRIVRVQISDTKKSNFDEISVVSFKIIK